MVWLQILNCMLRNTTQCLNTCQIISNQTQNISITFIQRRPNFFDVGPTLCKCVVFAGFSTVYQRRSYVGDVDLNMRSTADGASADNR